MKRYEKAKELFYKEMLSKSSGFYLRDGITHSIQVSMFSIIIGKQRLLDEELVGVAALFHDIHTYTKMNAFNHAHYSSIIAKELLMKDSLFNHEELEIIIEAIKNHSNKETIDDLYSECLKDADVLDHAYSNCITDKEKHRLNNLRMISLIPNNR